MQQTEPPLTAKELAREKNLHPQTIRNLFANEPGVIRLGRGRRQRFTLRIPRDVANRVFARMTVQPAGGGRRTNE